MCIAHVVSEVARYISVVSNQEVCARDDLRLAQVTAACSVHAKGLTADVHIRDMRLHVAAAVGLGTPEAEKGGLPC